MSLPIEQYKNIVAQIERAKGINTATARLTSEIFASTKEISLEELASITGYSLATVSNTIKFLEPHGIINRIKKPGSKKVYVSAERDFMSVLAKTMNRTHETAVRPLKQILPELIKEQKDLIKKTTQEKNKTKLKAELEIIEEHLKQVKRMEEILDHVVTQCNKHRK